MTRLPDPDRSRALLIGTGAHADGSDLPSLPAIGANLAHLRQVLTDPVTGSLPPEHCLTVADPAAASEVGSLLARVAQEATDLLFVYYGGHGLVDDRGRLHLALPRTDTADIRWTALPFETLREELVDSPAAIRVLVLDCCFSGRAIEAMTSAGGTVAGQIDVAGTYTLAATSANAVAYAPQGTTHTAFTGALLAALRGPKELNLDDLFDEVRRDLVARDMPRPQRRVVNSAGNLVLVRPPDPAIPRPGPAVEPSLAESADPGACAPPLPSWLQDGAAAPPVPRRPKVRIRIPVAAWVLLAVVTALLVFRYWLYSQSHWDKDDLNSALQQVATALEKEPWTNSTSLEVHISDLLDRSPRSPKVPNVSVGRVEQSDPSGTDNYAVTDMGSHSTLFCMRITSTPKREPSSIEPVQLSVKVTAGTC
ncbi:caspase domain-containing protein [Streptomyces sp. NPDC059101]|uniref:caspase family protein n=1 Tax=unclassified Streptomyces TaxID=2593676 RepID=UPI00369413A4